MTETSQCRYCGQAAVLCKSHAIPDTYFRRLARKNNGQTFRSTNTADTFDTSQESGWDYLLCAACEAMFNQKLDKPSIKFLDRYRHQITSGLKAGEFDNSLLARFLLSIVWRAGVSQNPTYRGLELLPSDMDCIKTLLQNPDRSPLEIFDIEVFNLIDSNIGAKPSDLIDIITPPTSVFNPGMYISMGFWGFSFAISKPEWQRKCMQDAYLKIDENRVVALDLELIAEPVNNRLLLNTLGKLERKDISSRVAAALRRARCQ